MGRPLTENGTMTAFRISPDLLDIVEDMAEDEGVTRSEMIRRMVRLGVEVSKQSARKGAA